jgi:hypothetical protein
MWRLLLESYRYLVRVAFAMHGPNGLQVLYDAISSQPCDAVRPGQPDDLGQLCHVMDVACVFYLHRVLCLQRSAATTMLLRHHGIPAQMVIGVKQLPFRSHAWVEVGCSIVNDKPYLKDIYQEIERL